MSALLALALAQLAGGPVPNPAGPLYSQPSLGLPMVSIGFGGAGFPVVTQLCDAVTAADQAGDWFCLRGDGTMASGSTQTLSAVTTGGTLTAESQRYCPNGPDCSPALRQFRTNANSDATCDGACDVGYEGSDVATGTSDVTICQELNIGPPVSRYENFFHKGTNVAGIDLLFQRNFTATTVGIYVGGVGVGTLTLTPGKRSFICMTVVAGAGTAVKGFVDGVRVVNTTGTLTNNVGPYRVSGYASGAFPARKQTAIGDTFFTRTVLSEARIAELAHRVLADQPSTSRGDVVETDRSTVRTCASSDGQVVSVIGANQACVSSGRFQVRTTRTNYAVKGASEFDSAPWSLNASGGKLGTLTPDYAVAPDGTKTADRIELPAITGAGEYSRIFSTGLGAISSSPGSSCVYVKGTSASGSVGYSFLTGYGTTGWTTCPYAADSWTLCKLQNRTVASGGTENLYIGNDFANDGSKPAQDFLIWQAQVEPGVACSAAIPAYTAAVQHVQEVDFKFPKAALVANGIGTTGCFAASYIQHGTISSPVTALGWMANAGRALYLNSTWRAYDGTNEPTAAAGLTLDVLARGRAKWSGSTLTVSNLTSGVSTAGSFDGTMDTAGYPTATYFTFCSAASALGGAVGDYECGDVVWDTRPEVCR